VDVPGGGVGLMAGAGTDTRDPRVGVGDGSGSDCANTWPGAVKVFRAEGGVEGVVSEVLGEANGFLLTRPDPGPAVVADSDLGVVA